MVTVEILGKKYSIKNEFTDVTIRDMVKVQEYLDSLPIVMEKYLFSEDEIEISEGKLLKFYVDWIELFSDIPREYLEGEISVQNTDELSLVEVFGLVSKFLYEPQDIEMSEVITLNGKEYKLIEATETASGVSKMLGGGTFKHFEESQALATLFQDKKYKKWEYLSRMTAILFRPEGEDIYEEEIVDARAKAFKNLPLSEAYKGYFFLHERMNRLQSSTEIFSEVAKAKGVDLTPQQNKSSTGFIGRFKPMSWLRRVFLTKQD